jgi:L-fuconolactonase
VSAANEPRARPPGRTIDSHQHFWRYDAALYEWIDESMGALRRDFLPMDLEDLLRAEGVDGTIAVQARQDEDETEWLIELAHANRFISGVVG